MKTLIITEKLSVACKVGALGRKVFGTFTLSNGKELTPEYIAKSEKEILGIVSKMGKLENDRYVIKYAVGHLVGLYDAKDYNKEYANWRAIPFPYIPEPFKLKIKESTKNVFYSLEESMNSSDIDKIIVATDADREGSAIFYYIKEMTKCTKPCYRLWTNAFTENGIEKAYNKMKSNTEYKGVEDAGYGRMISDFLMGALLTAKATVDLGYGKDIINVGRVQTTVLAEIVRVEDLIKNFSKKKSYQVVGKFKTNNGEIYEGVYQEKYDTLDKALRTIDRLKGTNGIIGETTRDKEKKWCPPLFDQTSLAIELSNKYNMSPDETLKASQSLYEKGYQTYPRTASRYITFGDAGDYERMYKEISNLNSLALKYPFNYNNKRIVDDSKVESHGAIVPTESVPNLSLLTLKEKQAYTEVMLRAIALNFPAAIDEKHVVDTMIKDITFHSTGKVEIEPGYREVYKLTGPNTPLPIVSKGEEVEVIELSYKEVESKPPKRYTEASILSFMETCGKNVENEEARELIKNKGIGTSATRAEVIKKLFNARYIESKGKSIYPTEKGIKMINILPCEEIKNPEFTGDLEYRLYKVESGESDIDEYLDYIKKVYIDACNKISNNSGNKVSLVKSENSLGKCPKCNNSIVHRKGKGYDFYGCTNWKGGCKFSISEICGKKLTEKQVIQLLQKGETNKIKGFRKKDGTELPSAKVVISNNEIKLDWNC